VIEYTTYLPLLQDLSYRHINRTPAVTKAPHCQSTLAEFLLQLRLFAMLPFISFFAFLSQSTSQVHTVLSCAIRRYINTTAPASAAPATHKPCTHTPPLPTLGVALADAVEAALAVIEETALVVKGVALVADVADEVLVAVVVQVAAVGRLVMPAGLQISLAYASAACWSALSQALYTQQARGAQCRSVWVLGKGAGRVGAHKCR